MSAMRRTTEAEKAAVDNLCDAWAALGLIRLTLEELGPVGCLPAVEHLPDPTFDAEAQAIVAGIQKLAESRGRLR